MYIHPRLKNLGCGSIILWTILILVLVISIWGGSHYWPLIFCVLSLVVAFIIVSLHLRDSSLTEEERRIKEEYGSSFVGHLFDLFINVFGVTFVAIFLLGILFIPLYLLSLFIPGLLDARWLNLACKWFIIGVPVITTAVSLWCWGYQSHQEKLDQERRARELREYRDKKVDDKILRSIEEKSARS